MTAALITEEELATEHLRIDPARAARLRRDHHWPHVNLGRYDKRYTEAQVEQILALESRGGGKAKAPTTGQTARSAARSA